MQRGYKTELKPNNKQKTALAKHAGVARYAYNWALGRVIDKTSKPNAIQLHKEWNVWKKAKLINNSFVNMFRDSQPVSNDRLALFFVVK